MEVRDPPKPNSKAGPGKTRPRRLLLCLDGVPHKLIELAKSRGLFNAFHTPTHLLSPFPTMTNVALSAMFGATPPCGYESLYFDRESREQRGGIGKYLGRRTPDKIPSSYMDDLDYQEPLMFEFLIYVAPDRVWQADMRRFYEKFSTVPQTRDYFAFLKATDGLLHAQGPARLNIALETLDKILNDIRKVCGNETEIVLFSDHGMNLEENKRVPIVSYLKRRNFQFGRMDQKRAVSVPAFGLCSYAAVYCGDEDLIPEVSSELIELEGVDFVVYKDADSVLLRSLKGNARFESDKTQKSFRYVMDGGDPLELQATIDALKIDGRIDERGFAADEDWFTRTRAHRYPDAVRNIFKSLQSPRVKQTADVLVSLHDGYYYGWTPFERFVTLEATHGNALSQSSNAFLMSTHREFPEYVRADNAKPLLKG